MTIPELYQLFQRHPSISTDTRRIKPGCIFFALKGDKFDANTFSAQALAQGAAYAVIDNAAYANGEQFILVADVLTALQQLARYHREQFNIPVIGLTGSNGKTTTKELIHAVLSQRFKTHATTGNLNNHIGVPLTLLELTTADETAVIEMGANHQHEIELLCNIARPNYGLITNIGKAHLEGFGGTEGIKKGKGELFDFLKNNSGTAFINRDSPVLVEMAEGRGMEQLVYYGSGKTDAISATLAENNPYLKLQWQIPGGGKHTVQSRLTGAYNLANILAAICIGHHFGLSPEQINRGIENYNPQNNRSQIVTTGTNTLICDYYNANPSSMFAALDNIGQLQATKKVAILGDMFELGAEAGTEHEAVIAKAMATGLQERIFIGAEFYKHSGLVKGTFYHTTEQALAELKAKPIKNATILVKGSRGMALERLLELF